MHTVYKDAEDVEIANLGICCQSPLPVIAAITEATWFSRTRLACNQLAINLQPTADAQPTSRFPT